MKQRPVFPSRYQWIRFEDLPKRTPADDIVAGMFGPCEVVALAGEPGSGKSTLVMDLAVSLAGGRDTFLAQKVQHTGSVFIAAGEGMHGLKGRLLAAGIGQEVADRMAFLRGTPDLANERGVGEFIESLKARAGAMAVPPVLVVIDTLAQALSGANENLNSVMAVAAKNAGAIASELNCTVLLVHHRAKGSETGLRGGGALTGAVDVVLSLKRPEPGSPLRRLETEKQRDRDDRDSWEFEVKVEEVEGTTAHRVVDPRKASTSSALPPATKDDDDKATILAFLVSKGAKVQSGEIREATGLAGKRLLRLLKELEEDGEIEVGRAEDPRDKRNTRYSVATEGAFDVEEVADGAAA